MVGVMSGIMDNLGIIISQFNLQVPVVHNHRALHCFEECERGVRDIVCISIPIIDANVSYFLIEHMNRMLSFMYHSTRVHRLLWNKCVLLDMQLFKDKVVSLSFETAAVGKWLRNVVMCAMNRWLQLTTNQDGMFQTQIGSVLSDSYKTYVLVPVSVTVLLSALTLYLAVVVLDVNVMLLTFMHLYYINMS